MSSFHSTGARAFQLGDFPQAVKAYTQAIAAEPENAAHYTNRAAAYIRLGDMSSAIADANAALTLQPDLIKAHGLKGTALIALQQYDAAILAYQKGLEVAPTEEALRMGLLAANYGSRETTATHPHRAVTRIRDARKAIAAAKRKARHANTASAFIDAKRRQLNLEKTALQAQLDVLSELEKMNDAQKLELVFSIMDSKGDGFLDAAELAEALRRGSKSTDNLANTILENTIKTVAAFDTNKDAKLDLVEFKQLMEATRHQMNLSLGEVAEFMALQLICGDDTDDTAQDALSFDKEVRQQEEYIDLLTDPRMKQLFRLFDKDGNGELSFAQVACGLYRLTHNMAESSSTTMGLLLTLDKDDQRTLDYEQFGRLVMAVVAASDAPFDQVMDDLLFALTMDETIPEAELQALVVTDAMYEGVLVLRNRVDEIKDLMDPLVYGRTQLLFDQWNTDRNGLLSQAELVAGLQHFHEASHDDGNPEEEAATLLGADHDGDHLLDRLDFARALGIFAQKTGKDLHTMIDFLVVASHLGEQQKQSYKRAFRHSVSMDAAALALKSINNLEEHVQVDK